MSKTYYEILGLPQDANEQQIKLSYHKMAQKFHPDKAKDPTEAATMQERFSEITTAYNALKDKEKRNAYDQTLTKSKLGSGGGGGASPKAPAGTDSSNNLPNIGGGPMNADSRMKGQVAKRAFKKGLQLMQAGEHARASEFFENAIKNEPADAMYHAKLAQTLLRANRAFNRAQEAAKRAIELDPYNSEFRIILAELYEAVGSHSKAIETYQEILKWDQTNDRAQAALNILVPPPRRTLLDMIFAKKKK